MPKCDLKLKLQRNVIEIALWYRCSPINLLHIIRTPFYRNTSGFYFMATFNVQITYMQLLM